ncbi:MAG: hypothetical protein HY778_09010 [Betaproteobacteria bacterium]|nr:hypothetical protein [Betaproteobacteria bacterium]
MKKTLIALGLALAFSQGAMAAQADVAAPTGAMQVLGTAEMAAATMGAIALTAGSGGLAAPVTGAILAKVALASTAAIASSAVGKIK